MIIFWTVAASYISHHVLPLPTPLNVHTFRKREIIIRCIPSAPSRTANPTTAALTAKLSVRHGELSALYIPYSSSQNQQAGFVQLLSRGESQETRLEPERNNSGLPAEPSPPLFFMKAAFSIFFSCFFHKRENLHSWMLDGIQMVFC